MNTYIIPKYILDDIEIVENNKLFKIKFTDRNLKFISTFGILIKLNIKRIVKKMNMYLVYIYNIDELITYDNFLLNNIKDYKNIVKDNNHFVISTPIINKEKAYINIKYVKKTGFLNIPIIELYNGR